MILIFSPKAIGFPGLHPRPPRLSPPQADDGGQVESLEKKILMIL
jgi:hypothetical protein